MIDVTAAKGFGRSRIKYVATGKVGSVLQVCAKGFIKVFAKDTLAITACGTSCHLGPH
jgi:hypothetical protein